MNFGKLFFLGFPDGFDDEALEIIRKYKPAGVILYPGNMKSVEELQISMDKLYNLDIPLLISSDHEGGQLETVPGILSSSGNYAMGKLGKPEYAYKYGKYLGEKLKEFGFNMVFSPVLDVLHKSSSAVTGFRAFSTSADVVAEYGIQYIRGLKESGILPTGKHFPGHGKAAQDSHEENAIVYDFSFDDEDIIPFKKSLKELEILMTSHVIYEPVDNDIASVSKIIINDFLKENLKFKGLVISDAIEMKAFYNNYYSKEGVIKFFNSGGDILMVAEARQNFKKLYAFFEEAIKDKKIKINVIQNKIKKIEDLQRKYYNKDYSGELLMDIAKRALKINIKNNFDKDNLTFLIPEAKNLSPADTTANDLEKLENLINSEFKNCKIIKYDPFTGSVNKLPKREESVVSFVLDSFRFKKQLNLQKKLKHFSSKVLYIIIRNDEDLENYLSESYIVTNSTKLISLYQAIKAFKKQFLKGEVSV
ncbi:glycoside hydrolase family 3 N-terminal domain-containing protein [Marinitoga aeolica]|uniref:beta-N-acetylhexosaminidase n=1 Tax=Marinitoga aeolica TaxID=2809031 RepID=A0ABY8PMS9_9BACT|nr:glycoside hydrolase family 3 N-terminal domain-containing protein [Marinitoga aeolica]WGS63947.1 glycoside hydrolase family 3 protein [Marinitoga aeolica]